ncbi:MAG: hypothetical protein VX949_07930 [Planctomycetota bacterium]|nr:hypothetical protein [Planctomycetota bacterium]
MPISWILTLSVTLSLTAPLPPSLHAIGADDTPRGEVTEAQQTAASAALTELQARINAAWEEYMLPFREAKTDEERDAIQLDPKKSPTVVFLPEMLEFTRTHAGTDACLEALQEVMMMASRDEESGWVLEKVVDTVLVDYIEAEGVKDLVRFAHYQPPSAANLRLLRAVADRSPHREARASAFYALSKILAVEKGTRAESRILLGRLLKEYADVTFVRQTTYGDLVKGDIFELEHLQIGHVAPEIIGKEIDGNLMQLSAFRGKVVLLDFWGDW